MILNRRRYLVVVQLVNGLIGLTRYVKAVSSGVYFGCPHNYICTHVEQATGMAWYRPKHSP